MVKEKRVYVIHRKDRPYYLRYVDDFGSRREVSSGTTNLRQAQRKAATLERDLFGKPTSSRVTWQDFRDQYEREVLPHLSRSSAGMFATAANSIEAVVGPRRLGDLDQTSLMEWVRRLQRAGLAPASVRSYWGTLRAALGWAEWAGLIAAVPKLRLPRGASRKCRGRAVSEEEFELILAAVNRVRPRDSHAWRLFLQALWHSGLRVDELRRLSWESGAEVQLTDDKEFPLIRIRKQKNKQDVEQPITPEFWDLCKDRPRIGWVFPLGSKGQMSTKRVVRTLSAIGAASGVIADEVTGRTVSSHDFGRRSFLTRMDGKLTLPELQKWARHSSPVTTMTYYYHRPAIELARRVWPGSSSPSTT